MLTLREGKPNNQELFADILGHKINGGTIPADILCTLEILDLVFIDRKSKKLHGVGPVDNKPSNH